MKKFIFLLFLSSSLHSFAQELAADYILPSVYGVRKYYKSSDNYFSGDLAKMKIGFESNKLEVQALFNVDGSLSYKLTHRNTDFLYETSHSYFLKFNASSAQLYGYSKHGSTSILFGTSSSEKYQDLESFNYFKIPNESYQTVDLSYTDPHYSANVSVVSSYKNYLVNGYEKRMLVVDYKKGNLTRKEIYMKHFGLLAYKDYSGNYYIADMKNFNLYSKNDLESISETDLRSKAWNIYKRAIKIEMLDSFFNYQSPESSLYFNSADSVFGIYEHLFLKYPESKNGSRFVLSTKTHSFLATVIDASKKLKKTSRADELNSMVLTYFIQRPSVEFVPKAGLSKYATNVDAAYYSTYWKMLYLYFGQFTSSTFLDKSYAATLMKPYIDEIIKYEEKIDDVNKCILFSYVANYYNNINESGKRYIYIVKSIENYPKLSQSEKDLNIEYMRNVMKVLSTGQPENETDLNRAIKAVLNLKDYNNAIKIADNGQKVFIGKSKEFAFLFADAAFNDDLNKEFLRKAMGILKDKVAEMSSLELQNYIKYCHALEGEFDCIIAENSLKKVQQKEQEEKEKQAKENKKKSRTSSGKRFMNLAIMANPFAGLNIGSTSESMFKFLPMSVALRTGKVIHEFRYNHFFGSNFKNRFTYGKINSSELDNNDAWKNLKGGDYSYELVFVKNEFSSYKKSCNSMGGGLQLLYGSFESDAESITVRVNSLTQTTTIKPRIKRYEGVFNFNFFVFSWKNKLSATMFYGVGAGLRNIEYNSNDFTESELKDSKKTEFFDKRLVQENWKGAYITFRGGFRFGFTLF